MGGLGSRPTHGERKWVPSRARVSPCLESGGSTSYCERGDNLTDFVLLPPRL